MNTDRSVRLVLPVAVVIAAICHADGVLSARTDRHLERVVATLDHPQPSSYRALRRLQAGNAGSGKQAWLEAWTELQPGRGLTVQVVSEGGSAYIRDHVLRNILTREQELISKGESPRVRLLPSNYEFQDDGLDPSGAQRILLRPLRQAHGIVDGTALVSVDGHLLQVAGRLTKNPSFWVRNVDVTWRFDRVGSAVLPIEIESRASVRMYGSSSFKMTYDYVAVDGRAVEPRLARRD